MTGFVPYERPRGSIHSLAHLDSLSDCRDRILCVSERTLYLLHNYASLDVDFHSRFAEDLLENGYIPVDIDSELYPLFESVNTAFKFEVDDMTCDIESGLNAIAESLSQLADASRGGSGACGNYVQVAPCVSELTNEQLLGPGESDSGEPFVDPPPEGFDSWEDYLEYKCQAAHYIYQFLLNMCSATTALAGLQLASALVVPVIAGATGILPAALTPAGFVILVGAIVAISLVSILAIKEVAQMRSYFVDNEREIICAMYNSQSTTDAVSAVSNLIEDAIQAIIWPEGLIGAGPQLEALLSLGFSQLASNGLVEPLFKLSIDIALATVDCEDCGSESDCFNGPRFDPGCGALEDEPCGSGILTPGADRVWTSYPHPTDATHRVDARLDTNRTVTVTGSSNFTPALGADSVRVFSCEGAGTQLRLNGQQIGDVAWPACGGLFVFVSSTAFTVTVNISNECSW